MSQPRAQRDPLAPWRITLPTPDAGDTYSFPDPDYLTQAYLRLRSAAFPCSRRRNTGGELTPAPGPFDAEDVRHVLDLARGYLDLTTYELGQECCVAKLRDIWRSRRRRGMAGEPA